MNRLSLVIRGLLAATFLALSAAHAEVRTLTDSQGRTIKADVVSVDGDKVVIKREDGQSFTIPLSSLSKDDQVSLKEWALKQTAMIPPSALRVELSRGAFDSSKKEDIAVITTEEKWGYSVTVTNTTNRPLSDLRFEYVLFVKPDLDPGKDDTSAKLKRSSGSSKLDGIGPRATSVFRTDTIKIYKQKLKPGWIWGKTGQSEMIRDKLYGIWIKTYVGDQLVSEICNPEMLAKTEKGP